VDLSVSQVFVNTNTLFAAYTDGYVGTVAYWDQKTLRWYAMIPDHHEATFTDFKVQVEGDQHG
jgi:hypothetical protein